jgi:hypothetical protein
LPKKGEGRGGEGREREEGKGREGEEGREGGREGRRRDGTHQYSTQIDATGKNHPNILDYINKKRKRGREKDKIHKF